MSIKEKETSILNDYPAKTTLSVTTDTILTYKQQFYLNVKIEANTGKLPAGCFIKVTSEGTGITIDPLANSPISSGNEKEISNNYFIAIDDKGSTIQGGKVSFTIDLMKSGQSIYSQKEIYNVKGIKPNSLQLLPNKQVCVISKSYAAPAENDTTDRYIIYEAQLLEDGTNTPLKNALVYLVSIPDDDIINDVIITSDQTGGSSPFIIYPPTTVNGRTFISLTSDSKTGKVRFRVYPNNKPVNGKVVFKPDFFVLACIIFGQSNTFRADTVCFITPRPFIAIDDLDALLFDSDDGVIKGSPDDSGFDVTIQADGNYKPGDRLLFFTKEKNDIPDIDGLIQPIHHMKGNNEDTYTYSIPFINFQPDKWTDIFYVIASKGSTRYSMTEQIKYLGGGADLIPSDRVNRVYNKIEVYSSFANYQNDNKLSDPEEANALLWENSYTTLPELANYVSNGGYDAFLKIIATNDSTDTTRPKAGDNVFVNMYIRSENINSFQELGKHALLSTVDHTPLNNTTLCTTVIPILHPLYTGISSFGDSPAWVYFEYYTMDESNQKVFSHTWRGMTDTSLSGSDDD